MNMGFNQQQLQQIQQQILTNASTNPSLMLQLRMNPGLLNQMVQQYVQQSMQQQGQQQGQPQGQANVATQMGQYNVPINNPPPVNPIQQVAQQIQDNTLMGSLTPTFQQMQYMLQIFKALQQMGLLNVDKIEQPVPSGGGTITLPNGDRIVALEGDKYGLIRSKK
jgi:hypothetical protein